mmetsp:Transcript_16188/g.23482  ORF Transcript_16188/g.23482 Transcript_16188/m.23482 type:complete len:208 (-) Transcript_16188:1550-2173(-)
MFLRLRSSESSWCARADYSAAYSKFENCCSFPSGFQIHFREGFGSFGVLVSRSPSALLFCSGSCFEYQSFLGISSSCKVCNGFPGSEVFSRPSGQNNLPCTLCSLPRYSSSANQEESLNQRLSRYWASENQEKSLNQRQDIFMTILTAVLLGHDLEGTSPEEPGFLHRCTDASMKGAGAVLMQHFGDGEHPIAWRVPHSSFGRITTP